MDNQEQSIYISNLEEVFGQFKIESCKFYIKEEYLNGKELIREEAKFEITCKPVSFTKRLYNRAMYSEILINEHLRFVISCYEMWKDEAGELFLKFGLILLNGYDKCKPTNTDIMKLSTQYINQNKLVKSYSKAIISKVG